MNDGKMTMEWPCYRLPEGATPREMRMTAIRAMRDFLTLKWTPVRTFTFTKRGSASGREFRFSPDTLYAGLPYTNGETGIYQWLASMDGRVLQDDHFENMNETYGATCATTVTLGLMAACNSVKAPFMTFPLIPKNGFYPVGAYRFPADIRSFWQYSTTQIAAENGARVMYEAYAAVEPADFVVSSGPFYNDNHCMMAIENAVVVRDENGRIDGGASFLVIQDQRTRERIEELDGETVSIRGRLRAEIPFEWLYEKRYIPMTVSEFFGGTPYVSASAALEKDGGLSGFLSARVLTNYAVCVGYGRILNPENGEIVAEYKRLVRGTETQSGSAYCMPVSEFLPASFLAQHADAGNQAILEIEVVVANGERFAFREPDLDTAL